MIPRFIEDSIKDHLFEGRVIILYGARQVGKTTLVKEIQRGFSGRSVYLNCDEPDIRYGLESKSSTELKHFFGDAELVILDEAQRVKDIGLTLKIAVDSFPKVQVIATGSSSFELANQTSEALTGRKYTFHLHPISWEEFQAVESPIESRRLLDTRLIYGCYPAVNTVGQNRAIEVLQELAQSYLYKDVLVWKNIRHPEVLDKLLRALALQLGSEVSYTELARLLGIDKVTVENYLQVLEQAFIIFRLTPFSRNLRTELKKLRKIYFWDTGIRNAIIHNLNPLEFRNDTWAIWENFVISERVKSLTNKGIHFSKYFWRTHQQQEIDYIEEKEGQLLAAEIKFNPKKRGIKFPKTFLNAYPEAETKLVTPENIGDFITK